ncbi:MAG TPA: hypothetical protein VMT61_08130 [Candidatus Binataceae bacterium]|nr:hypothetical protein [Candidatus Binataceae bacterium]
MKRPCLLGMLAIAGLTIAGGPALAGQNKNRITDVMTQNLYFGADLVPLLTSHRGSQHGMVGGSGQ